MPSLPTLRRSTKTPPVCALGCAGLPDNSTTAPVLRRQGEHAKGASICRRNSHGAHAGDSGGRGARETREKRTAAPDDAAPLFKVVPLT